MGGGGGGADEDEEDEEELLLEGALLEDEDAGCGGARSGPGSRGSIEVAGCVGAREGRECSRIDARLFLSAMISRLRERTLASRLIEAWRARCDALTARALLI